MRRRKKSKSLFRNEVYYQARKYCDAGKDALCNLESESVIVFILNKHHATTKNQQADHKSGESVPG
jgi:hypothetical protein